MILDTKRKQETTGAFLDTEIGQSIEIYNRIIRVCTGEALSFAAFKDKNDIAQVNVLGLPICTYINDLNDWRQVKNIAIQAGDDAALGVTMRLLVRAQGDEKRVLAYGVKHLLKQS